ISNALFPVCCKYGNGLGSSCNGLAQRKGSKASMVTTQHEIDEPKFLAKKGPNGTYSQVCKSRADQSFNNTIPNMWFSASLTETLSPIILASAVIKAVSNSKSTLFDGPKTGCVSPFGKVCPIGLFTGTPDGTMVELLPW